MFIKLIILSVSIFFSLTAVSAEQTIPLTGQWQFTLDKETQGEQESWFLPKHDRANWRKVTVPHTWNTELGNERYYGTAWYSIEINPKQNWQQGHNFLEFDALYRDAKIWLNGKLIKQHKNSGWTPFSIPVDDTLLFGQKNTLTISVDNSFSNTALPIVDSFDWANDGGMIRAARLRHLPKQHIGKVHVSHQLTDDLSSATVSIKSFLSLAEQASSINNLFGLTNNAFTLEYSIYKPNGQLLSLHTQSLTQQDLTPAKKKVSSHLHLSELDTNTVDVVIKQPELWHFDFPKQYRVEVRLLDGEKVLHQQLSKFGLRSIALKNGFYYLNNEPMRLMGVEWMPGSDPRFGMAESPAHMRTILEDMKKLNTIITRFHWQQDSSVFEFMDQEGMLVQEEIPAWQKSPENEEVYHTQQSQSQAMIFSHFNHPSIYAWGVGNEMGEQGVPFKFAKLGHEVAKQLDPNRLTTYASHRLQAIVTAEQAVDTASSVVDFLEWNDYYESWYGGSVDDVLPALARIEKFYPEQSLVISEYGLCECQPEFVKGDQRRIEILKSHTDIHRKAPNVAGSIFFSYNDYRTHRGDKGQDAFQQRVHGVVDLSGKRKPSWQALREESSPIKTLSVSVEDTQAEVALITRALTDLPAYTLNEYTLIWNTYDEDDLPLATGKIILPSLKPGAKHQQSIQWSATDTVTRIAVEVFRPTGYSVHEATWSLSPK
jgi:beta-glucuronidase